MAKGNVDIGGTMDINSVPTPNLGISHVYANGNITMGGNSKVDGYLSAGGIVIGGTGALGTEENVPAYPYPSAATTDAWRTAWIAEAQAGGTANNLNGNSNNINAPKYINGNISMSSSEKLTLNGPGIIYIDGDVKLTASATITNGATLIIRGTFSQQGQSVYKITTGMTQTPTMMVYGLANNGSVPSPSTDIIELTGGSSSIQQGIIDGVNGSIKVAGNSIFYGSLISGSTGGSVHATGTYDHKFPESMASRVVFPTAPLVTGVTEL
ncbi:MAG: hypothetical protein V4671_07030 [Armatimonadota bacterium]